LQYNVLKKTISELVESTKKEISKSDRLAIITSDVESSTDETFKKVIAELNQNGVSDILNPVVFLEAFPKHFPTFPVPDYKKWNWSEKMFYAYVPSPIFVMVFDKPSFPIVIGGTNISNTTIFLFEKHVDYLINDLKWFNSMVLSTKSFEERTITPMTADELNLKEGESGAKYDMRLLVTMLNSGLRPGSILSEYVARKQHNLDHDMKLNSINEHTPVTPKFSEMIDVEKITSNKMPSSDAAVKWYEFTVLLDPKNSVGWLQLGFIHKENGDNAKSENCFRQCIRHNPSLAGAFHALSHILTSQGYYKKALQVIDDGLQYHDDFDLHNSKALCLLELGEYDESIRESRVAIDIMVKDPRFDINVPNNFFLFTVILIVRALLAENRTSEIIPTYEPVLKMCPKSAISFNNFGYFLEKDGQIERAVESWKKCLTIDSDVWSANLSMGIYHQKSGNFSDASLFFDKTLKKCPEILHDDVAKRNLDALRKFRDAEMKKTFPERVSELGGFSLVGEKKTDVKKFVELLRNCKGDVLWLDPYFSQGGFTWIEESCISPTEITSVRILTTRKKEDELVGRPFRKRFVNTKKELLKNNISLSLRVIENVEHLRKIHASCLMSGNGSWEVPRVNNIQNGSKDKISPSDRDASEFDMEWNDALDFEKDSVI